MELWWKLCRILQGERVCQLARTAWLWYGMGGILGEIGSFKTLDTILHYAALFCKGFLFKLFRTFIDILLAVGFRWVD
jgi:hypothetical protein